MVAGRWFSVIKGNPRNCFLNFFPRAPFYYRSHFKVHKKMTSEWRKDSTSGIVSLSQTTFSHFSVLSDSCLHRAIKALRLTDNTDNWLLSPNQDDRTEHCNFKPLSRRTTWVFQRWPSRTSSIGEVLAQVSQGRKPRKKEKAWIIDGLGEVTIAQKPGWHLIPFPKSS